MWWTFWILLALFLFVCVFMVLLILIQKGRGGGLASAFGGAGGNTAFGSKTGDVLTWATSVVFGVFLLLAIVLNLVGNRLHAQTMGTPAAAVVPAAAAPTDAPPAAAPSDAPAATPAMPPAGQPVEAAPAPAPGGTTQPSN